MASLSSLPFPTAMDHSFRRSTRHLNELATVSTPPLPGRLRRHSEQPDGHGRSRAPFRPKDPSSAFRPPMVMNDSSNASGSSRPPYRTGYATWAGHSSASSDTSDITDLSQSFTLISSVNSHNGLYDHWEHSRRHGWPTLDPYRPVGVRPHDSQVYIIKSRASKHPRQRCVSLFRCLTRGGLALFDINPRWAKRRPWV